MNNLKDLIGSDKFIPVREWFEMKCEELKDISKVEKRSAQLLQYEAHRLAYLKLREILSEIIDFEGLEKVSLEETLKEKRKEHGL